MLALPGEQRGTSVAVQWGTRFTKLFHFHSVANPRGGRWRGTPQHTHAHADGPRRATETERSRASKRERERAIDEPRTTFLHVFSCIFFGVAGRLLGNTFCCLRRQVGWDCLAGCCGGAAGPCCLAGHRVAGRAGRSEASPTRLDIQPGELSNQAGSGRALGPSARSLRGHAPAQLLRGPAGTKITFSWCTHTHIHSKALHCTLVERWCHLVGSRNKVSAKRRRRRCTRKLDNHWASFPFFGSANQ